MDDSSDGSPGATRGASITESGNERTPGVNPGLLDRLRGFLGTGRSEDRGSPGTRTNGNGEFPADNPFDSRNPPLRDFAVPRAEIVAVSLDTGLDDLVNVFRESGRTRLPVFEGTLDDPKGFVHLKDLALEHGFNGTGDEFSLRGNTLHNLLYVAGSMQAADLLAMMRAMRIHMALVIDEYGGVDGLVTLEDLIEVIFGEIADEHDDEEVEWQLREEADGVYVCQARCPLEDLAEKFGRNIVRPDMDEEIDTLGGLVSLLAGRVPVAGEVISDEFSGLEFEIVSADSRRIKEIRIRGSTAAEA